MLEINGLLIKNFRKAIKMSQEMFAKELGVSRRTLQNYESDNNVIPESIQNLIKHEIISQRNKYKHGNVMTGEKFRDFMAFLEKFDKRELDKILQDVLDDIEHTNPKNKDVMDYSKLVEENEKLREENQLLKDVVATFTTTFGPKKKEIGT